MSIMQKTFFAIMAGLCACILANCGYHAPSDNDGGERDADPYPGVPDAGGEGLQLVLPFASDNGCVLTRAYCAAVGPWSTDIGDDGTNYCSHRATARYNDAFALDFACVSGTPVVAAAEGTVARVRRDTANWGHHVVMDHGDGLFSLYAHLSAIDVVEGQRVRQGGFLGDMGSTGNSTGPHVHFSLMRGPGIDGPFEAVVPEPMSGYEGFHQGGRRYYGVLSEFPNLPIGTILRGRGRPEIYVVCGDMRKCHIADWDAFATRRFFHDASDPLDRVVTVSLETLSCYQEGEAVTGTSVRTLVRCAGEDFLLISEGGRTVRRRIPFDPGAQTYWYDVLLRSWGFSGDEWRDGSFTECRATRGPDLTLRDGTLIELASDNDFYVVTADAWENEALGGGGHGYVRRIRREIDGEPFMPLLYRTYDQVLIVPDDAVFTMTAGAIHGKSVFDAGMAAECRYGPGFSGGSGGDPSGTDGPPFDGGEPPSDPPHTIRCDDRPDALEVTITGPMLDALIAVPSRPIALQYGSDTDGWSVPYAEGSKPSAAWIGDGTYRLLLPPGTDGMNFKVVDGDDPGRDSWFDLDSALDGFVPWTIAGDCRRDGTRIVRTNGSDGVDPPDPPDEPAPDTPPRTIACSRTASSLTVRISGPVLDSLHGGTVASPSALQFGSNTPFLWTLPYAGDAGRPSLPWRGDDATYEFVLDPSTDGMNFFVADGNGGGRWFDLDPHDGDGVPWNVTGDCVLDGTIVMTIGP